MSRVAFRLVAAQAADAATFALFYLLLPSHIGYVEQNPIILAMLGVGGVGMVIAVKMGIAAGIAWLYERERRKPRRDFRAITVLMSIGAAIGLVGAGFNLASLLMNA